MCAAGIIVLTVFSPHAGARTESFGRIQGRVTDKSSSTPIPFADVVIQGTRLGTYTRTDGTFVLPGVTCDNLFNTVYRDNLSSSRISCLSRRGAFD